MTIPVFCALAALSLIFSRRHMLIIVIDVLLVMAVVTMFIRRISRDPYGSFHLDLNIIPGEAGPKTAWLNMGYWKDISIFPLACEALALKVINAARCTPGGIILDVGHGSGDSLLIQLKHPSVPRPSLLVGVTSLKEHHTHSLERVISLASQIDSSTQVDLFHSDAISHVSDSSHPLSPSSSLPNFTSVIAIDCAYHFNTRSVFLLQAFQRLAPAGRIALADICFSKPSSLVSLLIGVPVENMISPAQYVQTLQEIGFEDVELEDISDSVFPGFIKFLESRGVVWRLFGMAIGLLSARGARFVVVSAAKPSQK